MHINRNKCANKQFELFYSLFNPNIWLKTPYNYIVKWSIFFTELKKSARTKSYGQKRVEKKGKNWPNCY